MDYEAVVIGGGAAGLSAALVLGRAQRRTLVLDEGSPSNAPAHAVGGLLGQHDTSPLELLEKGREQLAELESVEIRQGTAGSLSVDERGVEVDGIRAEAVLVATGMHYARPDLPGLEELWGDTVFHCPFCHGYEVRGEPLGVMVDGPKGAVMAQLMRAWSDDVVLLADPDALEPAAAGRLSELGIPVDGRQVEALRIEDGRLAALVFAGGEELPRRGLLIQAPTEQRSDLLDGLGLELSEVGTVAADSWGHTNVKRVWAAGDVAEPAPSVPQAISGGSRAAGAIVRFLMLEA